jgi:phosphoribosylformylglycinamidine cyclo-ligase
LSQYKQAGVDVAKTDRLTREISGIVDNIGGFGGLFDLGENYLVSSTDGVGTKILLAQEYNKLEGIGIDCVAMCVNDIICSGARPLFFLDYFASSSIDEKQYLTILNSIKRGCEIANIPLIGGETAELPGLMLDKHFDIAGFCVGVVKKESLIDGRDIKSGDVIVGLSSSGFHSNGYSLIRKVFDKEMHEPYIDGILRPTEIYVNKVMGMLDAGFKIKGIAHITGGGLSNLDRILPQGLTAHWNHDLPRPFVFELIEGTTKLTAKEMRTVFNDGIGMCLVVSPEEKQKIDLTEYVTIEAGIIKD